MQVLLEELRQQGSSPSKARPQLQQQFERQQQQQQQQQLQQQQQQEQQAQEQLLGGITRPAAVRTRSVEGSAVDGGPDAYKQVCSCVSMCVS